MHYVGSRKKRTLLHGGIDVRGGKADCDSPEPGVVQRVDPRVDAGHYLGRDRRQHRYWGRKEIPGTRPRGHIVSPRRELSPCGGGFDPLVPLKTHPPHLLPKAPMKATTA